MKSVVIGGTGQVGRLLISFLLKESSDSRVVAIIRNLPEDPQNFFYADDTTISRLSLRVVSDFNTFDFSSIFNSESFSHAFSTLGTTTKKTQNISEYRRIDHDYPVKFAAAARAAGISFFSIVTSMGASPSSAFSYLKLKGEVEKDIIALNFPSLCILRPGFLKSSSLRENSPWYEVLTHQFLCPIVDFIFPLRYTVHLEDVAMAMVVSSNQHASSELSGPAVKILENKDIIDLSKNHGLV